MPSLLARLSEAVPAIAVAALMLAAAPAAPIQDWSNIETVVVTAHPPGPALWHIARGSSDVWILAMVSPLPRDLAWDKSGITSLLKGANALLLPPTASVGLAEGLWFYMWHMDTLEQPDGVTLEATLSEPLKGRFIAARGRARQDADRYDKYLPAVAALILESDFQKAIDFSYKEPQHSVEALATSLSVPVHTIATYPAMDVIHDVPKMSAAAQRACMEYALSDIDTLGAHGRAAAEAWARGDLGGIKANYSETRLEACMAQNASYLAIRQRGIQDEVSAIVAALNRPGKTVAAIPMGFFLRKGGVLERLEAAGLTVSGP
ncbi:MAG TPA: TraB/GumN family protein [Rhizomicrobium sp.]|nr:TraB/GumN family protein [Rhizomicrobium sp.]